MNPIIKRKGFFKISKIVENALKEGKPVVALVGTFGYRETLGVRETIRETLTLALTLAWKP